MATQVFGNTLHSLRGAAVLGIVLSLSVSLAAYFMATAAATQLDRAIDSALLGIGVLAIVSVALLPSCLFSLRVDETRISHVFLGRFLLSSKAVAELRSLDIGKSFGATLTFSDGTKIRFFGARLESLRDLCECLRSRCGDSLQVETGGAVAGLLMIDRKRKRMSDTPLERTRDR